ncbi:unnamed protein product [Phytophthora fragariaefolia]|uniref:Unnamed protein product n=1 Tax=Phytophthora fragariaefolia TaxID=1490495 RepID=A0A9W6X3Z5_9STRA|nr:unnamed protein product [Phytophthora fragariaefolia]
MSTPTTQTSGAPATPAAADTAVASTATTRSSTASTTSNVTSTVTTSSSPKRTMSLGKYKKARGKATFFRHELQALFDDDSDADMEEDKETSSPRRNEQGVGSRRPREDDSDASSSKRSRCDSDRPLADVIQSTGWRRPHSYPWVPTPSEIQYRFGNTAPLSQYAVYSCSGITDDDVTKELTFDLTTDQRCYYYIGLFHDL